MAKIKSFIKRHWAYMLSVLFIWIVPIIMLNETIALVENVSPGLKITFMGCIVLLFVFFSLRKKINVFIEKRPHGILRGVLLCLHKLVTFLLVLGILWALYAFSDKLFNWWILSGISFLIGFVFIILNEHIIKKGEINETDKDKVQE